MIAAQLRLDPVEECPVAGGKGAGILPDAYGLVATIPPSACWLISITFAGMTHGVPSTNAETNQSLSALGLMPRS